MTLIALEQGNPANSDGADVAAAVNANTAKVGITPAQAAQIVVNNAKVSNVDYDDTTIQGEVDTNTAKVGITTAQAAQIVVNNAKVSNVVHPLVETAVPVGALFTDTDTIYNDTAIVAATNANTTRFGDMGIFTGSVITDNVTLEAALQLLETAVETAAGGGLTDSPSDGNTYGRKDGAWAIVSGSAYDDTAIQALVATNTAKVGITTAQAAQIVVNNAKETNVVHPLVETAVPVGALFTDTDTVYNDVAIQALVDTNTAKTGITTAQAAQIVVNNGKETNVDYVITKAKVEAVLTGPITSHTHADNDTVYDDTAIQALVATNTAKTGITAQQATDITAALKDGVGGGGTIANIAIVSAFVATDANTLYIKI